MKNINVKKIVAGAAALGVGALMISGAMAANVTPADWTQVTKEDLFNNGVPAVSIVVGNNAQPIDVVWAGNIAAAIGKNAHTVIEGSEGGYLFNNVIVEVGTQGTSVISGDGKLEDSYVIDQGSFSSQTEETISVKNNDYSVLFDDDVSGKIEGDTDYEIRLTETLDVNVTPFFSSHKDVEALALGINGDDIVYTLDFEGSGLPHSDASDDYFKTGDDLDIRFMGKVYSIQSIDSDGLKVSLVESGSKTWKQTDDILAVTGTDGEEYSVVIGNVFGTSDDASIFVELKDSTGAVVDSDYFEEDQDFDFSKTLEETITVVDIRDDTSDDNIDRVELTIGEGGLLELEHNKVLPNYDDPDDLWKVYISGDANYVDTIMVKNNDLKWDAEDLSDDDSVLSIGESIPLPLGLGSIDFLDLTEETVYDFILGNDEVTWDDSDGVSHTVKFFEDDVEGSYEFDGQDYYFDVNADNYVTIRDGSEDDDPVYNSYDDVNANTWDSVILEGNNDLSVTFKVNYSDNDLHLALSPKSGSDYTVGDGTSSTWNFVKTITSDFNSSNLVDVNSEATALTYYGPVDTTSDDDDLAIFKFTDDSKISYIFVDPYTGDLAVKDDYEESSDYYTEYAYGVAANDLTSNDWKLDQDDSDNDMANAYTIYGSYVQADGSNVKIETPEDARYMQVFVGGGVVEGNDISDPETFTLTEEGVLVSDEDETISAKLVSKNIEATGSGDAAIVPAVWNPANLVILDTQTSANPKVIVGGYLVNALAEGIGLEDVITTSTDYVVGKNATGNIVVAGMDAADTEAAARELIAAIEAM